MAKTTTENKDLNSKNLSTPKDGFIQKKKNQKFKQTPTGKIPLINGSKASNNNNMKKQQLEKQKNSSPQKFSEKNKELKKENLSKTKKKSNKKSPKKSKTNSPDSNEDINEGVVLKEETDDTESEEESEYEEQEKSVPNILGTSLADDTEEDDEEFTVEDKKEKVQVNKGVKMFKGLKSSNKKNDSLKSSDRSSMESSVMDDSDEDEDEDEDEVEMEEHVGNDEESEDEEVEEEEEEEDDEDEDEEESENEGAESALGIKALLDNSIVDDDDDDEDFVEPEGNEEDDDISDEDEEEAGERNSTLENSYQDESNEDADSSFENMKKDSKTIFVGNLPKEITKKDLQKLFKKFGKIDSMRIRGIVPKNVNMPKKVAVITKNVHPKLKSVYAYIKFTSEESAKAAVELNGTMFEGNHLRVDLANKEEKKYDGKKSIFLGNLPFKIDENTIRKHFESCGEIESVRVVKDNKTGVGKGFGYVNFMTEDAVALAFELNGTTILNRSIVVKSYVEDYKGKHRKRSYSSGSDKQNSPHKQLKQNSGKPSPTRNKENTTKKEKEHKTKKQISPQQTNMFQGQKADRNKKKKESNLEKKKKILAKKLTAKPKKPTN